MSLILDTHICVTLLRGGTAAQTLSTLYQFDPKSSNARVSVVTIGELYSLATQWQWGQMRWDALDQFVQQFLIMDINDETLLLNYSKLDNAALQLGRSIGKNDLWIAATAVTLGDMLLMADVDFECLKQSGLQVIRIDPRTGLPTP